MPYKDKAKKKEFQKEYEKRPEVKQKNLKRHRDSYARKTMNAFDVWAKMVKEGGIGHYSEYHELFDRGILPTSIVEYSHRNHDGKWFSHIHTIPRNPMDFNDMLIPRCMKGIHRRGVRSRRYKEWEDEYKRRLDLNMKLDKVDIMINTQKYTGKMS